MRLIHSGPGLHCAKNKRGSHGFTPKVPGRNGTPRNFLPVGGRRDDLIRLPGFSGRYASLRVEGSLQREAGQPAFPAKPGPDRRGKGQPCHGPALSWPGENWGPGLPLGGHREQTILKPWAQASLTDNASGTPLVAPEGNQAPDQSRTASGNPPQPNVPRETW